MSWQNYKITLPKELTFDIDQLNEYNRITYHTPSILSTTARIYGKFEFKETVTYSNKDGVVCQYSLDVFKLLVWMKLV